MLSKGYKVFGTYRRVSTPNFWRLQQLKILHKITLIPADLTDMSSILEAVKISKPNEIYNLAAQSYVGASFDQPLLTTDVDGSGATRFLEIIRHLDLKIKFYQASTSELYGACVESPQHERTPFIPHSPYGAAKLYSFYMTQIYRKAYGIFTCNGILFNHESPFRGLEFVTRKITNSVAKIKLGLQKELRLGNLDARRDWGFAPEYVEAMWLMMQQERPDDFVIATGETHSVREFVQEAFAAVGLNWQDYVKEDQRLRRPLDVHHLCGDARKAQQVLGWKAKTTFRELVSTMVNSDLERWKKNLAGELFPWDAPNYSSNIDILSRTVSREGRQPKKVKKKRLRFRRKGQ